MTTGSAQEVGRLTPEDFAQILDRHVGHTLRCARETTGNVGRWRLDTVALRCDDCGEVLLEAQIPTYPRKGKRARA